MRMHNSCNYDPNVHKLVNLIKVIVHSGTFSPSFALIKQILFSIAIWHAFHPNQASFVSLELWCPLHGLQSFMMNHAPLGPCTKHINSHVQKQILSTYKPPPPHYWCSSQTQHQVFCQNHSTPKKWQSQHTDICLFNVSEGKIGYQICSL
jgi:hypothetical protein